MLIDRPRTDCMADCNSPNSRELAGLVRFSGMPGHGYWKLQCHKRRWSSIRLPPHKICTYTLQNNTFRTKLSNCILPCLSKERPRLLYSYCTATGRGMLNYSSVDMTAERGDTASLVELCSDSFAQDRLTSFASLNAATTAV